MATAREPPIYLSLPRQVDRRADNTFEKYVRKGSKKKVENGMDLFVTYGESAY